MWFMEAVPSTNSVTEHSGIGAEAPKEEAMGFIAVTAGNTRTNYFDSQRTEGKGGRGDTFRVFCFGLCVMGMHSCPHQLLQ